ncbi:MAG: Ig-like domain-containing protein [Acidimicrobiales bacterium]
MRSGTWQRLVTGAGWRRPVAPLAGAVLATALVAGGCARASSEVSFPSARAGAVEVATVAPGAPRPELAGADAVLVDQAGEPRSEGPAAPAEPLSVTFHPAPGTVGVPLDAAVGVEVRGGELLSLEVASPEGVVEGRVELGAFQATDGLRFATEYTLQATVRDATGELSVQRAAFATMDEAPTAEAWIYPNEGDVVGVGMPVIVSFSQNIPPEQRSAVTARLSVHSEPSVPGAWRWMRDDEVHWRPLQYWPANTEVWVAAQLGGTRAADRWFTGSILQHFTIGQHHRFTVDAATHQMVAYVDGVPVRQMPISTGKDAYPTASGTNLIMEKHDVFEMDSSSVGIYGAEAYNVVVDDALRLTNSGTFIHAAPWNGSLGEANLSHGCINASSEDAQWMMDFSYIGDPVEISNTPERLAPDNGWGVWNLTAEQWLAEATP